MLAKIPVHQTADILNLATIIIFKDSRISQDDTRSYIVNLLA